MRKVLDIVRNIAVLIILVIVIPMIYVAMAMIDLGLVIYGEKAMMLKWWNKFFVDLIKSTFDEKEEA